VPAGEIERFVLDEIRCIGRDPALLAAALAASREAVDDAETALKPVLAAPKRRRRDHTVGRPTADWIGTSEMSAALHRFAHSWDSSEPPEQARLLQRLVKHIHYDGQAGSLEIGFCPDGIRSLAADVPGQEKRSV
jgi:hypothetical protein